MESSIESQIGESGNDLSPQLAERVVAYDEAKAAGMDGQVDGASLEAAARDRLARNLACVDLLHRAWSEGHGHQPRPTAAPPAEVLGDFRLIREIGRGGMGTVYEAEQLSLRRRVALKVLPFAAIANEQQLRRFMNEARAAATLQHPHIVPVYSVESADNVRYYTMQYIDGPNLAEVLEELRTKQDVVCSMFDIRSPRASNPTSSFDTPPVAALSTVRDATTNQRGTDAKALPSAPATTTSEQVAARVAEVFAASKASYFRTVAKWGVQLAEALAYAHANGVLHRDIKPANILLDASGQPWITDFGLARLSTEATMTMTGDLLGTLRYMAPEQALGKRAAVDHRADTYSLALTLYELLSLRPAFSGHDRQELLQQIAFEEPCGLRKVDRSIPVEMDVIIRKAASRNPGDRYDSAQELADDLQRFLAHKPILARPPRPLERALKWVRRRPSGRFFASGRGALGRHTLACTNADLRAARVRTASKTSGCQRATSTPTRERPQAKSVCSAHENRERGLGNRECRNGRQLALSIRRRSAARAFARFRVVLPMESMPLFWISIAGRA
jgi:serine/threonine protein kinase